MMWSRRILPAVCSGLFLVAAASCAQAASGMHCLIDNGLVKKDEFGNTMTRTVSRDTIRFTHAADGDITVRLRGHDVRRVSHSDRALLEKDRRRRINKAFAHYATRSDSVDFLEEPDRRWSWGIDVRPTNREFWQVYLSSRISDDCLATAIIEYPREYAATSYPGRLMTLFHQAADRSRPDDLAVLLREDVDRPTGGRAQLYGIALPLGIGILVALMSLSSRKLTRVYFSLYDKIAIAALPAVSALFMIYSTVSVIAARAVSDGIELVALGVLSAVGLTVWVVGNRHHQVAYLAFLTSAPISASLIYAVQGWSWTPSDVVMLGAGNVVGLAVASHRIRRRLAEIRVREHLQAKKMASLNSRTRT